ncbi:hypothetical protein BQ8482_60110 [Mesorhizobium delmotii]|uniref:Uncharacterized protein n=1 Tax=Mesorhizobium delmotii TaxID=1631247 RepID=A0A2P9AVB1_9HYPH|nr:hypothetical protein BQ8482_60110 [Mesorhizobium delmotii]
MCRLRQPICDFSQISREALGITALTPFAAESVSISVPLTNGRLDLGGVTAKMLRERGAHQWLRLLFLAIGPDSTRDRS